MSDTPRHSSPCQAAWNAILYAGGEQLAHDLWCSTIRLVAASVLMQRGVAFSTLADDDEDPVDALVREWFDGSMPQMGALAMTSPHDVFRDYDGRAWDEKVWFGAEHCEANDDELFWINGALEGNPDAQDALTKASLERYYNEWKANVVRRVLHHAKSLHPSKGGGSC